MSQGVISHWREIKKINNLYMFISLLYVDCFLSLFFNHTTDESKKVSVIKCNPYIPLKTHQTRVPTVWVRSYLIDISMLTSFFRWVFQLSFCFSLNAYTRHFQNAQSLKNSYSAPSDENSKHRQNFRNFQRGASTEQRLLLFNRQERFCCMADMENNIEM